MHHVPVIWTPTPFYGGPVFGDIVPEGLSIAEIVERQALPPVFATHGIACVDGEVVPRAMWPHVRPRTSRGRDVIVTLHVGMQGGGAGGGGGTAKNVGRTVATIAVLAAATFVTGGGAAALFGSAFAAGTIGATAAGAAITLGGALAIGALAPPPTLKGNAGSSASSASEAEAQGSRTASLSGNALAAGGALPRVIGTHRVFPPFIVPPLTEIVDDQEYAEAVFGLAGPHKLEDIRIGATRITDIPEISYEVIDGLGGNTLSLVSRQSHTSGVQIELSGHSIKANNSGELDNIATPDLSLPKWHQMVSRDGPDEVWLTVAFPRGLFDASLASYVATPFRLRVRKRGTSTWINLPEVHVQANNKQTPFAKEFRIKWSAAPSVISAPDPDEGPYLAFKSVPTQTPALPTGVGGWTADAWFSAGAGNNVLSAATVATTNVRNVALYRDRAEFFLDPSTKGGVWEIEIVQAWAYDRSSLTPSTYAFAGAGGPLDFFGYYLSVGVPETWEFLDDKYYRASISRLQSIWNERPVLGNDFAMIALRVHNRQIENLSVQASGYVRDWDDATETWSLLTTTSNPAPHLRDVLTGLLNADPLPERLIDGAEIVAWRDHCIDEGLEVNAVTEGQSADDVAAMICAAGMARLRRSETWGVIVDRDRSGEAPEQVFTARNLRGFTFRKASPDLPDGLRVSFNDAALDYRPNEIIVLDPEIAGVGRRLQSIQYDGLVTEDAARARALFDLAQGRRRMTFYEGETHDVMLTVRRGSLVAVQHDIIDRHGGYARIKSILREDAGNPTFITGFILDGSIENETEGFYIDGASAFYVPTPDRFYADPELGVAVRLADGTVEVHAASAAAGEVFRVTLETPFADAGGDYEVGAMVTTGRLAREYRRMIVTDIRASSWLTGSITLVDEAPEIHE